MGLCKSNVSFDDESGRSRAFFKGALTYEISVDLTEHWRSKHFLNFPTIPKIKS